MEGQTPTGDYLQEKIDQSEPIMALLVRDPELAGRDISAVSDLIRSATDAMSEYRQAFKVADSASTDTYAPELLATAQALAQAATVAVQVSVDILHVRYLEDGEDFDGDDEQDEPADLPDAPEPPAQHGATIDPSIPVGDISRYSEGDPVEIEVDGHAYPGHVSGVSRASNGLLDHDLYDVTTLLKTYTGIPRSRLRARSTAERPILQPA